MLHCSKIHFVIIVGIINKVKNFCCILLYTIPLATFNTAAHKEPLICCCELLSIRVIVESSCRSNSTNEQLQMILAELIHKQIFRLNQIMKKSFGVFEYQFSCVLCTFFAQMHPSSQVCIQRPYQEIRSIYFCLQHEELTCILLQKDFLN